MGGWPIFALPIPRKVPHPFDFAQGRLLRFCKGGRRCCRRNSCPFYTARWEIRGHCLSPHCSRPYPLGRRVPAFDFAGADHPSKERKSLP